MMTEYFDQEQRTESERLILIKDEPIMYRDIPDWQYSFIAAMVHYLCLKHNLECPTWAMHKRYVLEDPYFPEEAYKDDDLRIKCLIWSPGPFKVRNMFLDENILSKHKKASCTIAWI